MLRVRVSLLVALTATVWAVRPRTTRADEPATPPKPPKEARAVRASEAPLIDGRLDDEAWALAPEKGDFHQNTPDPGAPATEATTFRVLYDDHAIYVGIRCDDLEPERINAPLARRDVLNQSDTVWVQIDSQHDHVTGFAFALTAAGVQLDARLYHDYEWSFEWDTVWEGEVTRDSNGWSAEFEIPLRALRFDAKQAGRWGFNVLRFLPRTNEDASWVDWPSQSIQAQVSRFGHLVGVDNVKPRRTFELRPFMLTKLTGVANDGSFFGRVDGDTETDVDAGLDLKLGLTSELTFDATINPDFGQVEADASVLNLSRFETFFPEKRPFFQEGFDLFSTPLKLFYTRRIGQPSGYGAFNVISERLLAQPPSSPRIYTAGKITGRATQRTSIALVGAVTSAEEGKVFGADDRLDTLTIRPRTVTAVARAQRAIGDVGSQVGLTATHQLRLGDDPVNDATADHDAYAQSLDLSLRSASGRSSMVLQGVVSERVGGPTRKARDGGICPDPTSPGCVPLARVDGILLAPGQVGVGGLLGLEYQGERYFGTLTGESESPTFDIDTTGYAQSWNHHALDLHLGRRRTEGMKSLTSWEVSTTGNVTTTWNGRVASYGGQLGFSLVSKDFHSVWLELNGADQVFDNVDAQDGAIIQRTETVGVTLGFGTNATRRLSFGGTAGYSRRLGEGPSLFGSALVTIQTGGALELTLSAEAAHEEKYPRFYACIDPDFNPCTVESTTREYLWGDLDSAYLSTTARLSWTFSTHVSLQTYAQLFAARGIWENFRGTRTTGTAPELDPRTFDPSATDGDFDGDGKKEGEFQSASLNLNVVLRWEPTSGTTLLGVYTRGQFADQLERLQTPHLTFSRLLDGGAVDVVLFKLVLFIS